MRTTIRNTRRGTTIEMKAGKGEDLRGVVEALTGRKLETGDNTAEKKPQQEGANHD